MINPFHSLDSEVVFLEWSSALSTLLTAIFASVGGLLLFYEKKHRRLESIEHFCTFGAGVFGLLGALLLIAFTLQHHKLEGIQEHKLAEERIAHARQLLCLQHSVISTAEKATSALEQLANAELTLGEMQRQNRIIRTFSVYVTYKFPPALAEARKEWQYPEGANQFGINAQTINCQKFQVPLLLQSRALGPGGDRGTEFDSHVHEFKYLLQYPSDIIGKDISILDQCESLQVVSLPIEAALRSVGDNFPAQIFNLTLEINGRRTYPISVNYDPTARNLAPGTSIPVIKWTLNQGENTSTQYLREEQAPIAKAHKN
jgi:hypothetical protein